MFLNIFLSFSLPSAGICWAYIVIFPPGDKKTFQCTSLMKLFRRTNFFCQKWPWTGSQKIDFAAESNCVKGIIRPHENVAVQHLQTDVSSNLGHKATAGICTEAKSCCYFISRCRVALEQKPSTLCWMLSSNSNAVCSPHAQKSFTFTHETY